ncbi:MAG: hypothetical protein NTX31_04220 [Burkholderiales bacterium]|jgi:hypothetical protein|nr:hypothetical protein [Burkholderiales bacterium]TSA13978.1 MAG: hypothetical protein D4R79_04535 [Comamonadaceae bacterium]
MLIDCYECKAKVSDTAASCPHCGALPLDSDKSLSVAVSDLDMKFMTIFWFLIKASVAAVPAMVVLYTASTVIGGIVTPLLNR